MMKKLDEMPKSTRGGAVGRAAKYPFDEWLTGDQLGLVQGEDYECKSVTIAQLLRIQAKKRGIDVRTVTTDYGLAVQAIPLDPNKPKRGRKPGSKNGSKAEKVAA